MVLDNAPDYREVFFRELARRVELTVVAQPCFQDNLDPPKQRGDYTYIEIPTRRLAGMYWQPGLRTILRSREWDVACIGVNFRQLARLFLFLTAPASRDAWVWRGLIYGRSENRLLRGVRAWFLRRGAGCLVYSDAVRDRLQRDHGIAAVSFNNSEVRREEFRAATYDRSRGGLRLLFVGRNTPRKRVDRLVALAERHDDVHVRLVGPGMEDVQLAGTPDIRERVRIYGKTTGHRLDEHFDWADLVANPGHAGLLVTNAARHGKGIVIDSESAHAPEYRLAEEANQPFIRFSDRRAVDRFVQSVRDDRSQLRAWAEELQAVAKTRYTVEYMVDKHVELFEAVAASRNR